MPSLEHLDTLIGESLECLVEASGEIKVIETTDSMNRKRLLLEVGKLISGLWGFREELYKIKPSLKRDFVVEYEQDRKRFDELDKLQENAFRMENDGDFDSAKTIYEELYRNSSFGYFRLIAEAGMWRVTHG